MWPTLTMSIERSLIFRAVADFQSCASLKARTVVDWHAGDPVKVIPLFCIAYPYCA